MRSDPVLHVNACCSRVRWTELRDEIRAHARILCCTHVVGYLEASTIHDDVAILSITGTAATIRGLPDLTVPRRLWTGAAEDGNGKTKSDALSEGQSEGFSEGLSEGMSDVVPLASATITRRMERAARRKQRTVILPDPSADNESDTNHGSPVSNRHAVDFLKRGENDHVKVFRRRRAKPCSAVHVPYSHRHAPFANLKLVPCLVCGKK